MSSYMMPITVTEDTGKNRYFFHKLRMEHSRDWVFDLWMKYDNDDVDLSVLNLFLDKVKDVNIKNRRGYTMLHLATRRPWINGIRAIMGRNPNLNLTDDIYEKTCLHFICGNYIPEAIRMILIGDVDVNMRDKAGCRAIRYALENESMTQWTEACELLVRAGARVDEPCENDTCYPIERAETLHLAALMVQYGANPFVTMDYISPEEGSTCRNMYVFVVFLTAALLPDDMKYMLGGYLLPPPQK